MSQSLKTVQEPSLGIDEVKSLLKQAYGPDVRGETAPSEDDDYLAAEFDSDLTYGEVWPEGAMKALGSRYLAVGEEGVSFVYDLGMGLGRLIMQAFLCYPNLKRVVGVELATTRTSKGFQALKNLAHMLDHASVVCSESHVALALAPSNAKDAGSVSSDNQNAVDEKSTPAPEANARQLEFFQGDMYAHVEAQLADIVICETKICSEAYGKFVAFMNKLKSGARLITYENMQNIYENQQVDMPFESLGLVPVETSWADEHNFYLWRKN